VASGTVYVSESTVPIFAWENRRSLKKQ
jgi:hypothetical protein